MSRFGESEAHHNNPYCGLLWEHCRCCDTWGVDATGIRLGEVCACGDIWINHRDDGPLFGMVCAARWDLFEPASDLGCTKTKAR